MFQARAAFSGFSVDDITKAKLFYTDTLKFEAVDQMGGFRLVLPGGAEAWAYEKPDHKPATFTILNFMVENIDDAVTVLEGEGVVFEKYDDMYQDERGIARGKDHDRGPNIAWFKDPAGNILAVLEA